MKALNLKLPCHVVHFWVLILMYCKCILLDCITDFFFSCCVVYHILHIFTPVGLYYVMAWDIRPITVPLFVVFFTAQLFFHHFKGIWIKLVGSIITLTESVCCWYYVLFYFYTRVMYRPKLVTKVHTGFPCAQDKIHTCELPCVWIVLCTCETCSVHMGITDMHLWTLILLAP